jgi:mRNA-degrading endonuclease toxin of MazEF toxin-antitoxin module
VPHTILNTLDQAARVQAAAGIRRRRVILVDLRGAEGREAEDVHPCVVVSNDRLNAQVTLLIVVPITSHSGTGRVGAHEVGLKAGDGELTKDCAAQPCQVRTIDRFQRVVEIWGELSESAMDQIDDLLDYVLSDA